MTIIKYFTIITTLLCSISFACAGWVDKQGNVISDSNHMKSIGDFGTQLVITDNEALALKNWNTPSQTVHIPSTNVIERNKIITAFIVFSGCSVDKAGNCDLKMQFTVYKPNGTIYSKLPIMEIWSGKPVPPGRSLGLSLEYMRVIIEAKDPLGKYKITANIIDKISGNNMLLTKYFTAIKGK